MLPGRTDKSLMDVHIILQNNSNLCINLLLARMHVGSVENLEDIFVYLVIISLCRKTSADETHVFFRGGGGEVMSGTYSHYFGRKKMIIIDLKSDSCPSQIKTGRKFRFSVH